MSSKPPHLPPLIKAQIGPHAVQLRWPFADDTPIWPLADDASECAVCTSLRLTTQLARVDVLDLDPLCRGCVLLKSILISFDAPTTGLWRLQPHLYDNSMTLHYAFDTESWPNDQLKFRIYPGNNIPPDIAGNTGSPEAMAWIHTQLTLCTGSSSIQHSKCANLSKGPAPFLPTRVVEVRGPTNVRLHVSLPNEAGRYICLSHCWGAKQPIRTLKENLDAHQRSIEWSNLPLTFQHCVMVAHAMEIRYVWIDSLCIVQDDIEDWQREGSRMADIYRSSYLVVGAAFAQDASCGLFLESVYGSKFQRINFTDSDQQMLIRTECVANHVGSPLWPGSVRYLPLVTRAWAFQEALLAPRMVYFTVDELIWSCQSDTFCECSEELFLNYKLLRPPRGLETQWHVLLERYTLRKLTYEDDILPALSGLAHHYAEANPSPYLAGLWEEDLLLDLMWARAESGRRPSKWRAPTWSWASVVGNVTSDKMEVEWEVPRSYKQVIYLAQAKASVELAGIDPFGQLKSGTLWLNAPHITVPLQRDGTEDHTDLEGRRFETYLGIVLPEFRFFFGWDRAFDGLQSGTSLPVEIALLAKLQKGEESRIRWGYCGLLLQSVQAESGVFERLGLIQLVPRDRFKNPLDNFDHLAPKEFTVV